jgi:hypothetical protein
VSIPLGIRIPFAGGRESLARNALMATGVAVGVLLLLFTLTAMPVLQRHIDRLAWHRTTALSPPTAPDPALWLAITDRYAGRTSSACTSPRPGHGRRCRPASTGCPARARWSSRPRSPS